MTDMMALDALLAELGPPAIADGKKRREVAREEAPHFHALSFFSSGEPVCSLWALLLAVWRFSHLPFTH
jgi:hypothetical protein